MKLLTVTVPCYNSEAYMRKCIDSLLTGGEEVEILIVDDGSTKDNTAKVADEYQELYPTIIRAIHQENKGHGGAVNTGIDHARGLFFKVVDSDDWVDVESFRKVIHTLHEIVKGPDTLDVMFCNYVYEKEGARRKRVMKYSSFMPQNRIFRWNEMRRIDAAHYVLMHSMITRTELLKEVGLRLPEHTFYVDNLFAFIPFSRVKTMYYLNVNLYRYYIGRSDQSVNEAVMISRLDQQINVNNMMIEYMGKQKNLLPRQKQFMVHSLGIIMVVSSALCLRAKDEECLKKKKALWVSLRKMDPLVHRSIRNSITGAAMNLPGKGGQRMSVLAYKVAQKLYGFN